MTAAAVRASVAGGRSEIVALTSLRGIAAWWVVAFHASELIYAASGAGAYAWAATGYLAVDLFFVMSGYIITRSYQDAFGTFSLRGYAAFLGTRLARIYPLHACMLVLYLSIPAAILAFSTQRHLSHIYDVGYFLLSTVLLQNWGFTGQLAWNFPAWSISTEWLAYILFPLLLGVARRASRPWLLCLLAAALLLAIAAVFTTTDGLGGNIPRLGAVRCVLEFWLGVCLCRLAPADPTRGARACAGAAFVVLFVAHTVLDVPDYAVMPAAFTCLVFALSRDDGPASVVLAAPVLHWLGTASYSTYLCHVFVREWVKFVLVRDGIPVAAPILAYVVLTMIASAVLYRYVELPGRTALRRLVAARLPPVDRHEGSGKEVQVLPPHPGGTPAPEVRQA